MCGHSLLFVLVCLVPLPHAASKCSEDRRQPKVWFVSSGRWVLKVLCVVARLRPGVFVYPSHPMRKSDRKREVSMGIDGVPVVVTVDKVVILLVEA